MLETKPQMKHEICISLSHIDAESADEKTNITLALVYDITY